LVSKYSSLHPVLKHPESVLPTISGTYKSTGKIKFIVVLHSYNLTTRHAI
jgi:hypothetical protein